MRFSPPSQPHRCVDAVRSCPEDFTDVELKLLCEQGPVSYSRGPDNIVYRNYFCQLCHGLLIGSEYISNLRQTPDQFHEGANLLSKAANNIIDCRILLFKYSGFQRTLAMNSLTISWVNMSSLKVKSN